MQRKRRLIPGDRRITIATFVLIIFGSLMIASAEMGNAVGDTAYLSGIITRQAIYVVVGTAAYFFLLFVRVQRLALFIYIGTYIGIMGSLAICRAFPPIGGAYAWIPLPGGATIQPSEFAKVFMIVMASKMLGQDRGENNVRYFWAYVAMAFVYFFIILVVQHDLGSAIVLFIICYCAALIPGYKELKKTHFYMFILILIVIALALFVMSPLFTEFLKKHADNYMVGRFLASADPFLYQYDRGYHVIMSLVSFANGGWLGLGYGNSIHKYMNFPNPSNDFILPVIVEELGIAGFSGLVLFYGLMLYPLITGSFRARFTSSKIILLGVFIYFITHFILNVGGVSGLIPLTGVPLLLISSGGSSMVASMAALGLSQNELIRNGLTEHEDNSRQIQENTDQDA